MVLDTQTNAGSDAGRPATAADARRIVALVNAAHADEELFVPYTVETLTSRLERRPDLYSWRDMRLGERAVVGVWPARLAVIRETGDHTRRDVRALVLDSGWEPGGEDEVLALLRAGCAQLATEAITELTVFTSQPSPVYSRLAAMAKRIEPYVLNLYLKEPGDLARRGIYVDQLYF